MLDEPLGLLPALEVWDRRRSDSRTGSISVSGHCMGTTEEHSGALQGHYRGTTPRSSADPDLGMCITTSDLGMYEHHDITHHFESMMKARSMVEGSSSVTSQASSLGKSTTALARSKGGQWSRLKIQERNRTRINDTPWIRQLCRLT